MLGFHDTRFLSLALIRQSARAVSSDVEATLVKAVDALPAVPDDYVARKLLHLRKKSATDRVPAALLPWALAATLAFAEHRAISVSLGADWIPAGELPELRYITRVRDAETEPSPAHFMLGGGDGARLLLADFREVGASSFPCPHDRCPGFCVVRQNREKRDVWSTMDAARWGTGIKTIAHFSRLYVVAPVVKYVVAGAGWGWDM